MKYKLNVWVKFEFEKAPICKLENADFSLKKNPREALILTRQLMKELTNKIVRSVWFGLFDDIVPNNDIISVQQVSCLNLVGSLDEISELMNIRGERNGCKTTQHERSPCMQQQQFTQHKSLVVVVIHVIRLALAYRSILSTPKINRKTRGKLKETFDSELWLPGFRLSSTLREIQCANHVLYMNKICAHHREW